MNRERKVLLVDQDDVLVEFNKGICDIINSQFGTRYRIDDVHAWNLNLVFKEHELQYIRQNPQTYMDLVPVKDSQLYLGILSRYMDIYMVSAAWWESVPYKVEWMKKYFPWFKESNMVFTRDKSIVYGDYIIDDGVHNIDSILKHQPNMKTILMNSSHNKQYRNDKVKRCYDWEEICDYILQDIGIHNKALCDTKPREYIYL